MRAGGLFLSLRETDIPNLSTLLSLEPLEKVPGGGGHPIPQGFSSFLLKPYIKAVTHFGDVEWWRTMMVECVTVFLLFDPTSDFPLQIGLQAVP